MTPAGHFRVANAPTVPARDLNPDTFRATSEIYYAQLVEEESNRTVMEGLREVIL